MATIQKTLGPGKDYETMQALSNVDQDLVSDGNIWEVTCDTFEDTAVVDFGGWITDPSNYLLIKAATPPTTPGSLDTGSYRLNVANNAVTIGNIGSDGQIVFEDIQIRGYNAGTFAGLRHWYNGGVGTAPSVYMRRCTVISDAFVALYLNRSGGDGFDLYAENCAFVGKADSAGTVYTDTSNIIELTYCTAISKYATNGYVYQMNANGVLKNCYAGKAAAGGYGWNGTGSATSFASSDSGDPGSPVVVAYDASLFENVGDGTEDFHILTGVTLIEAGTYDSGVLTDWDGATRDTSNPDIGLDEFALTLDDVPHDPSLGVFVDSDDATTITDAPLGLTILADPYTLENKYLGGVIYAQALAHANNQAYIGAYMYSEGASITPAHIGLYIDALPLTTVPNAYMGLHSSGLYQPTNASLGVFMYGHPAEDYIVETQGRLLVKANSEDATEQVLNIDAVTIFKGLGTASLNAQWIAKRQAIAEFYAKMKVVRYINPPIVEIIQVNYMEADGEPDGSGLLPVENFYEGARRIQVVVSGSLGDSSEWISSQIDFGEPWRGDAATTLSSISGFTTDPLWTADHVYETSGNYIITARGVDSYGSVGSDLRVLNLASGYVPGVDYPAMSISATPRLGDVPPALEVEFTTTPSGTFFISSPTDSRIFWNMGNRETSKRKDPTTYYSSPGLYTPVCRLRYSHPDGGYIWIADSLRIGYNY